MLRGTFQSADLDVELAVKLFPAELLRHAMVRMISPGVMRFFRLEFDDGNALAVRRVEGLDGNKTRHLHGQVMNPFRHDGVFGFVLRAEAGTKDGDDHKVWTRGGATFLSVPGCFVSLQDFRFTDVSEPIHSAHGDGGGRRTWFLGK